MSERDPTGADGPRAVEEELLATALGLALRIGTSGVAVLLVGAGTWCAALHRWPSLDPRDFGWGPAFAPERVIFVATLLLIALPPARVLIATAIFARQRDRLYVAFSLGALALLAISNGVGLWFGKG